MLRHRFIYLRGFTTGSIGFRLALEIERHVQATVVLLASKDRALQGDELSMAELMVAPAAGAVFSEEDIERIRAAFDALRTSGQIRNVRLEVSMGTIGLDLAPDVDWHFPQVFGSDAEPSPYYDLRARGALAVEGVDVGIDVGGESGIADDALVLLLRPRGAPGRLTNRCEISLARSSEISIADAFCPAAMRGVGSWALPLLDVFREDTVPGHVLRRWTAVANIRRPLHYVQTVERYQRFLVSWSANSDDEHYSLGTFEPLATLEMGPDGDEAAWVLCDIDTTVLKSLLSSIPGAGHLRLAVFEPSGRWRVRYFERGEAVVSGTEIRLRQLAGCSLAGSGVVGVIEVFDRPRFVGAL